jgi:putative iron-dependent peroxidase
MGGINLVAGFRPGALEAGRAGRRAVSVSDGFEMPGTQHDAVLWLSGASYDVIFDAARNALAWLKNLGDPGRRDVVLALPA